MRPAHDSCLFIIDEDGLLFSEEQQSIYRMNSTATYVWCLLESTNSEADIINEFSKTFSAEREIAAEQVKGVIEQWKEFGLINDGLDKKSTHLPGDGQLENNEYSVNLPAYAECKASEIHDYALLNTRIRIRYTSAEQALRIHPVLAHLESIVDSEVDHTIDIINQGESFNIYRDKIPVAHVGNLQALAPSVKGLVMQTAVNSHAYFIFIHGGIVAKNGKCILLPGTSGSGKSTLTAALSQSGFQYMSDEVALLEESTNKIIPTPIAISVKSTGWDILKKYYPKIDDLVTHQREDGKLIRYIPPPLTGSQVTMQSSLPVGAVIFPCYKPDASTTLQIFNKIDALQYILDDCLALPRRLTRSNIGELVQWIKDTPCYELTMSNLEEAVTLVQQLEI